MQRAEDPLPAGLAGRPAAAVRAVQAVAVGLCVWAAADGRGGCGEGGEEEEGEGEGRRRGG